MASAGMSGHKAGHSHLTWLLHDNTTYYISPATEMLYWHQNEINVLQKLVSEWNIRVKEVISKDTELSRKLEPLSSTMLEYKANPKQHKKEISVLKSRLGQLKMKGKSLMLKWKMTAKIFLTS